MTIDTMAPFAALAIAGMSFRGGADCAATTPATRQTRKRSLAIISLQSLRWALYSSMVRVEEVIRERWPRKLTTEGHHPSLARLHPMSNLLLTRTIDRKWWREPP